MGRCVLACTSHTQETLSIAPRGAYALAGLDVRLTMVEALMAITRLVASLGLEVTR